MSEEFFESRRINDTSLPEWGSISNLANDAHLYQTADRPTPGPLPPEFPRFVGEPDGSFTFTPLDDGSDSLLVSSGGYGRVEMTEAGDLRSLTVRLADGSEVPFELRDLLDPHGRFREGEDGTRTIDAHGTVTYTSLDGKFKIVIDRCGKVLSFDTPKGSYRPSQRRLGTSLCGS